MKVVAHHLLGIDFMRTDDFSSAREQFELALAANDAAPDASEYQLTSYVMVHSLLGALLCWTGFLDRGLAMASRGVELARRSKNIDSLTWQLVWMLAVRSARDEVAEYSAEIGRAHV